MAVISLFLCFDDVVSVILRCLCKQFMMFYSLLRFSPSLRKKVVVRKMLFCIQLIIAILKTDIMV